MKSRPPKCKRSWVYLYHVSTWVSHWRWKITLQLNTTNNRRTVVKKLVEMAHPSFPQYVKYAAASPIHTQIPFWRIYATNTSCCVFFFPLEFLLYANDTLWRSSELHLVKKPKLVCVLDSTSATSTENNQTTHVQKQSFCIIFPKCGPKKEKLGRLLVQPTCMNTYFVLPG